MKNTKPDYRRETKIILENILRNKNISIEQVSNVMRKTVFTLYRWKAGKTSPSRTDFERLTHFSKNPEILSQPVSKFIHNLNELRTSQELASEFIAYKEKKPQADSELVGRLEQLTLQIAHLQESVGGIKAENAECKKQLADVQQRLSSTESKLQEKKERKAG